MISWRRPTLQFLCLFVWRLHLTEANCYEELNPKYWEKTLKITFNNLTERINLVHANSFKDMINCTLENEIKKGRPMDSLWCNCMEKCENQTHKDILKCGKELEESVSFYDFMCLIANASDMFNIQACSQDVVVKLYTDFSHFHVTPFATTLPTTNQPPTTTKLTTTTAKSTTPEKSTQTSPPVTTWSTRPSASSVASQTPAGVVTWNQLDPEYTNQVVTESVVYSLLGLSVIGNLLLIFCVALLWNRRTHLVNSSPPQNGHSPENFPLVTSQPVSDPNREKTTTDPEGRSANMDSSSSYI